MPAGSGLRERSPLAIEHTLTGPFEGDEEEDRRRKRFVIPHRQTFDPIVPGVLSYVDISREALSRGPPGLKRSSRRWLGSTGCVEWLSEYGTPARSETYESLAAFSAAPCVSCSVPGCLTRDLRFECFSDVHHGAVEHGCRRHALLPASTLRIYRCEIPQNAVAHATLLLGLRRACVCGHLLGEHAIAIPILLNAVI